MTRAILAIGLVALFPDVASAQEPSPYAGWENREIKALSPEEVASLRTGEGMGYALAAELNGYPGPRHVLDLADSLGVSATQRDSVEAIRARMKARAIDLGEEIVVAEAALDSLFAAGAMDDSALRSRVDAIARLDGELRAAHLAAHLETRAILTEHQVARYAALRGYAGAGHGAHAHE